MTKSNNIRGGRQNPRVLVAPLDWGLGHATRCIPIINGLIAEGCKVYIAADKKIFSLLKKEFPNTVIIRCKGYEIEYSRLKSFQLLNLVFQAPKVIFRAFMEKIWLNAVIKKYKIDAVISDNRFGMYNKNIPSIYITHQLYIITGNPLVEKIAQKIHYFFIKKYTACWIPDQEDHALAGKLSHPNNLPGNARYIGPVSRFKKLDNEGIVYDLLIILSGPEPQRTLFENKILHQLKTIHNKILLVRGLPGEIQKPEDFNNVRIKNHLPANKLNAELAKSKMVLCRSGYTSIMDLTVLQKKAILVATPGQTEQEYLSEYLLEKRFFFSENQKDFSIKKSLKKAANFSFEKIEIDNEAYLKTLKNFVDNLKSGKTAE